MLKLLSTFSFYHARREAHSCFLSCEFLVESRASRRENPRRRVPSNEYQFARGCAAIVIARVLKQYPELSRDSASTISGKAPIRARKPKSGSRGEIITWARSTYIPKRPRSRTVESAPRVVSLRIVSMPEDRFRLTFRIAARLFLPHVSPANNREKYIGRIYLAYWEKPRWSRHRYGKMRPQSAKFYLDVRLRE